MRYTRYNYKKKGNNGLLKFLVSFILTIAAAGVIGLGLAKVIVEVMDLNKTNPKESYIQQEEGNEKGNSDNKKAKEAK